MRSLLVKVERVVDFQHLTIRNGDVEHVWVIAVDLRTLLVLLNTVLVVEVAEAMTLDLVDNQVA